MTIKSLIFLIILISVFHSGFAQQSVEQMGDPSSAMDLGDIREETVNIVREESFNHPGDMDWFKFNVNEPQKIFLAAAERDTYHGIILYDKNMNYVNSGELMLPVMLQSGTYYGRIEAYPIDKYDYQALNDTLGYTLLAGNSFEKESNDGIIEANNIGTLEEPIMISGEIDPENDIDFFRFDIPEEQSGRLKISEITNSLESDYINVVLYEYNESDERFVPTTSLGEWNPISAKPGSYIARVEKAEYSDYQDYILYLNLSKVNVRPLGILNKSVILNESGHISDSDSDFFEFEVSEPMSASIETSGEDGDSEICLYDSEQNEIECNDDYNGLWSYVESTLQAGKYYIEVGTLSSELSYNLTVKTINDTSLNEEEDNYGQSNREDDI